LLLAGAAAVLALLVYVNSLFNGFAYDDVWIVEGRAVVHGFGQLQQLLTSDYWPARFGSGLYRPLTLFSYAVDWSLWGGDPFGFHLTNIVLHASVAALLTLLLLRLFPWWAAFAGGAVFAVHSVHTEAVANVVGRGELLAALFVITACLIYVRGTHNGRVTIRTAMAVGFCYVLALLSKEVGAVLPALLLLLDLPRSKARTAWAYYVRSRLPLIASLAAILVVYFGVRWAVLGAPIHVVVDRAFVPDSSFLTRFFTMARVWPRYYELLLFPVELSADYSPAVILPASSLTMLGLVGILLMGLTALLATVTFRRMPELTTAVMWAAVTLLPVSNMIVVAEIVLAERTFYLPTVAVSIVVATLLARIRAPARKWLAVAVGVWIVVFSVATARRNPVWDSTETVFADLQENHPESSRLLWWLGDRRLRIGDWEGAREWYRRSLQVWPYYPQYLAEFAVNLNRRGEYAEAEAMTQRALDLAPDYPDYYSLLALIRFRRGDFAGVLEVTTSAKEAVGESHVLYALEADAYARLGDPERAVLAQRESLRLRGEGATWREWYRLAALAVAAGDTAAALAALDSLSRLPEANLAVADSLSEALGGYEVVR
jgi:tetratricopeptide (TPR) repeat protein